jgi:hypothetical protein
MLDVKNVYSLLSNSTYLSLLFDIIITHIEALVIRGHKVLYALLIEVSHRDASHFSTHSYKLLSLLNFYRKEISSCAGRDESLLGVWSTIPIWMKRAAGVFELQHIGAHCCEKHNSCLNMPCLFLYCVLYLVQCFTICCCIDCHASWEEFNKQNALPVPEHGARDFPGQHSLGSRLLWTGHTKPWAHYNKCINVGGDYVKK